MDSNDGQLSTGIYRWFRITKVTSTWGLENFYRRISPGSSDEVSDHRGEGLSGMKEVREPRVSVSKTFNPKRREIRVPEQRYGEKDANTTQFLRRGPISHTSVLVR